MLDGELHLVQLPQKLDRVLDVGTGMTVPFLLSILDRVLRHCGDSRFLVKVDVDCRASNAN